MADQSITQLPVAISVTGDEQTVIVQRGVTKQVQVSLIANAVSPGKLITNVILDAQNYLVFYYSDGTTSSTGPIPGYINATINGSGHLILTLTTGGTVDCGNVVGPTGPGVATGGTTGQVLYKTSNADYATAWETLGTMASQNSNSVSITGGSITNAALQNSSITINGSTTSLGGSVSVGTVTSISAIAGTGISVTGVPITTSGSLSITNTAPDQIVTLTGGTGISTSGTYPNFTISNTSPSSGGTVTSVSGTGTVNGITLTGTVTSSGSLTLGGTLGSIANSQLSNSTISGVSLGGNLFNLTAGTGVSFNTGTTYNGSAAITINATGTGGTVTSVAALTLGTTGTDLSSTVANSTTTPVITLNVPTASATNRGALSAADWTTFNSKAPGTVFTANYVPYGQGTSTLNQSANLQFTGTNLLLNQSYDQGTGVLQVTGQSTFNGAVVDKSLNLQGGNNLVIQSQALDNASWNNKLNIVATGNATTAPDGTTTATQIADNSTSGQHIDQQISIATATANINYVVSSYFKNNTRRYVKFGFVSAVSGSTYSCVIADLSLGTITQTNISNGTLVNYSIISVGNGWYRIALTTSFISVSDLRVSIDLCDTGTPTLGLYGGYSYIGNGSSIYAWGAQLELGTVASAYTPTTTAAITTTNNISVPSGQVLASDGTATLPSLSFGGATNQGFYRSGANVWFVGGGSAVAFFNNTGLSVATGVPFNFNSNGDTKLYSDASNTLAQRNSTNAQTFRLYNTYTDASNYERLSIDWSTTANTATIVTQNAGTGSARSLKLLAGGTAGVTIQGYADTVITSTAAKVYLTAGNTKTWVLSESSGSFYPLADATYDLGIASTNRIRNAYFSGVVTTNSDASINTVTVGLGGGAVSSNTAVGNGAMAATATGGYNSAFGQVSLPALTSGSQNSACGAYSLNANTTGSNNSAFGTSALRLNVTGINNTAVGQNSLYNNTASNNSGFGIYTLTNNTTASNLTAIGYQALYNNTTNVATLGSITGGSGYTNGTYTGVVMTLSSGSSAITYPTATIVVSGGAVTSVTLTSNGVGFKDTTTVLTAPAASIGGTGSGFSVPVATLASGTGNVAVGYQAGYTNSTGNTSTYVGYQAGYLNTTGNSNQAFGHTALYSNTTGVSQVAIGQGALYSNTTGATNTAIGSGLYGSSYGALGQNVTGNNNTAVGQGCLQASTSNNSTAIGALSLFAQTSGSNNIAIGYNAGRGNASANANTTGSNNTYIGYSTVGSANNNTNEMVIGFQAVGLGSNTTVIGNSSTTLTKAFGVIVGTNYTVATLPSASTSGVGARAFVTDALAPVFGATVVTGGAVATPVYSDGTNWKVG